MNHNRISVNNEREKNTMSQLIIDLDETPDRLIAAGELLMNLAGQDTAKVSEPVPQGEEVIQAGDTIVVAGREPDIKGVEQLQTTILAGQTTTVELDASGRPWDERIHAGSRAKVADDTWKRRRGITDELYNQVMAEIVPAGKPPAFTDTEIAETDAMVAATSGTPDDKAAAAAFGGAATPAQTEQPAPTGEITWAEFLHRLVAKQKTGTLDIAKQNELLAANGIAATPLLVSRPDLLPIFIQGLDL